MFSVNLDSIQDFSQMPVQMNEQNSKQAETSRDFFSMLNENLKKHSQKIEAAPAQISPEKTENFEKAKKNFLEGDEISKSEGTKGVFEEDGQEEVAKTEEESAKEIDAKKSVTSKKTRGEKKALKTDGVLEQSVFAKNFLQEKNEGIQKTQSKSEGEIPQKKSGLKAAKKNHSEKEIGTLKKEQSQNADDLRLGISKKTFILENEIQGEEKSEKSVLENGAAFLRQKKDADFSSENSAKPIFAAASLQEGGEKKAVFAKPKKNAKAAIEVKDLRSKAQKTKAAAMAEQKEFKKDFMDFAKNPQSEGPQVTLEFSSQSEKNIFVMDGQSAAAEGSAFHAMLKNQIVQNASDIVRSGNIILRENNSGTINLVLHPEELGDVKIGLELTGKVVTGHIVVQSREAFNAFGDGAAVLKNAFIQSGFEDAHFDVSYAGSQMQFAQSGGGQNEAGSFHHHGQKIYGEFVEENVSVNFENADKYLDADYSVNIVA